jgi:hypothetical protein
MCWGTGSATPWTRACALPPSRELPEDLVVAAPLRQAEEQRTHFCTNVGGMCTSNVFQNSLFYRHFIYEHVEFGAMP